MASVITYLNFNGTTEAAFEFYKSVFGTEYVGPIARLGDVPPIEGVPATPDEMKNLIMNIQLPTIAGHHLMGTDVVEGMMDHGLVEGNNVHIFLSTDSREDAEALWTKLTEGGTVGMPLEDQFWGDYYGSFTDKFGIGWMIAHMPNA